MYEIFSKLKNTNLKTPSTSTTDSESHNSYEKNQYHITKFSVKPNITPMSSEVFTPAYGFRRYTKLTKHIQCKSLILKQKAVKEICKLFQMSELHIINSVNAKVIPELLKGSSDSSNVVREYSSLGLSLLCLSKYGRDELLKTKSIEKIKKICNDNDMKVSLRGLTILKNLAKEKIGQELLSKECIPLFVEKAKSIEFVDVKCEAISGLILALKIDESYGVSLKNNVIKVFSDLLNGVLKVNIEKGEKKLNDLYSEILKCVGLLCFKKEGIEETVKNKIIFSCEKLFSSKDLNLIESLTSALMYITLSKEGKQQLLDTKEGLTKISEFIKDKNINEFTKVNCLKIVSNVAENPNGRKRCKGEILLDIMKQLNRIPVDSKSFYKDNLLLAIRSIKNKL